MHNYKKPYYTIYQRIGCSAKIFVNDVLISSRFETGEDEGGDIGDIPINQAILQSGTYTIKGKMYPRYGGKTLTEEEYMRLDFYVAEANPDKWKQSRVKFHHHIEQPWDGLSEGINYPYFEIKTEIEVELPFVLDGWQNSVDLDKLKEEKLFKEVLASYIQLHSVVKSYNVTRFLELSKEKMALQEQAFYFSEERKKSFIDSTASLFAQKFEIMPIAPNDMKLEIMGHGKLVKMIRKDNTEAIQFKSNNPEEESNIELEVKLHLRNKKQGFTII